MGKARPEPKTIDEFKARLQEARQHFAKQQESINRLAAAKERAEYNLSERNKWVEKLETSIEAIGDLCDLHAPRKAGPHLQVVKVVEDALHRANRGTVCLRLLRDIVELFPKGPYGMVPDEFTSLFWQAKEEVENGFVEIPTAGEEESGEGEEGEPPAPAEGNAGTGGAGAAS